MFRTLEKKQIFLFLFSFLTFFYCGDPQSYDSLSKRASAVIEVELYKTKAQASWQIVIPKRVFKNKTTFKFNKEFTVYHDVFHPPIPEGKSVIFIVPYETGKDSLWTLIGLSKHSER